MSILHVLHFLEAAIDHLWAKVASAVGTYRMKCHDVLCTHLG